MPLSVQFRWKTPQNIDVQNKWDRAKMSEGLNQLANTIIAVKDRRYKKEQDEYKKEQDARRNQIEDETNRRAWEAEDRRIRAGKETAETLRGLVSEREQLKARRERVVNELSQLKAQLGG